MKSWSIKDIDDATVAYIKRYASEHGYKVAGAIKSIVKTHQSLGGLNGHSYPVVPGFDWRSIPIGKVSFIESGHTDPTLLTQMILSPAYTTQNDKPEILGYSLIPMPAELKAGSSGKS